jgi:hypothetical protein
MCCHDVTPPIGRFDRATHSLTQYLRCLRLRYRANEEARGAVQLRIGRRVRSAWRSTRLCNGRASYADDRGGVTHSGRDLPFAPGGGLLRHPATYPQIFAVLDGSGAVSGTDGTEEPIVAGEAVSWQEGEEHEEKSAHGLTALIIEGQHLDRFRERPAVLPETSP